MPQDGLEIDGRQDPFVHITGGGELLKILRTFPSHSSNYTCMAVNEAGEDSLTFRLDVMGMCAKNKKGKTILLVSTIDTGILRMEIFSFKLVKLKKTYSHLEVMKLGLTEILPSLFTSFPILK